MDACFLSSNTVAFSYSIKAKLLTHPKKNWNQNQPKKLGLPFSITCCNSGSSSSPEDETNRGVDSDWRSFRAKLVAGERASASRPEFLLADVADEHPSTATVGDKWAHKIHEPEKGCLLIATEKLDGVHIFERTVILLLATGPVGPTGIILNRPSLMSIKETKSTALDVDGIFSDRQLFFGGPLEEGLFLVRPNKTQAHESGLFDEVMNGLYYGTKESVGCGAEMVKRNVVGVEDFRFFDGYCGWEKEQLRDEIRAGYWDVAACSPSVIGLGSVVGVGLWEEVLGLMGPKKVQMAHNYREGNSVADALAKQGSAGSSNMYWHISECPNPVQEAWCGDALGYPNWRQPKGAN